MTTRPVQDVLCLSLPEEIDPAQYLGHPDASIRTAFRAKHRELPTGARLRGLLDGQPEGRNVPSGQPRPVGRDGQPDLHSGVVMSDDWRLYQMLTDSRGAIAS